MTRSPRLAFPALLLLLLVGCGKDRPEAPAGAAAPGEDVPPATPRGHVVIDDTGRPTDDPLYVGGEEEGFDWLAQGPLAWIDVLRSGYEAVRPEIEGIEGGKVSAGRTVWGRHLGWVQGSDLPALGALLDDASPCLHVSMARSSRRPFGPSSASTVGREAAFLLLAFRSEEEGGAPGAAYEGYPPALSSLDLSEEDLAAVRAWWADRSGATSSGDGR